MNETSGSSHSPLPRPTTALCIPGGDLREPPRDLRVPLSRLPEPVCLEGTRELTSQARGIPTHPHGVEAGFLRGPRHRGQGDPTAPVPGSTPACVCLAAPNAGPSRGHSSGLSLATAPSEALFRARARSAPALAAANTSCNSTAQPACKRRQGVRHACW